MSTATSRKPARYRVDYPSGRSFEVVGVFSVVDVPPWREPAIDTGKSVVILDQRAIVSRRGKQVYHPRRNPDGLAPGMRDWLRENPSW